MAAKKPTTPALEEPEPTTVWLRNDSPQGDLEVPLLGRDVDRGEIVEVSAAHARLLTPQDIWSIVDAPTNNGQE